ncbi:MAG: type VI secretion system protein ImpH [Psychromonas sp.]|jgi:type VI secretion system protein ImpH|uniref:type VI secretion system baseplate subunit TssG n=1 Tax=Psychromonas sp. TaxID=1884585 RepID=UPI0039E71F33
MSSTSWRKNTAVIDRLTEHPHQFSFKQAVRILERSNNYNTINETSAIHSVGGFMPPQSECVRFATRQSLSFASSEISSIKPLYANNKYNNQWKMTVNFIGLTGSQGVLPYHYTETVLKRLKVKDKTIMEFFDLFNHRTASLFFQSSTKYFVPLQYERSRLHNKSSTDNFTKMLLSLVGLGTKHLGDRLYTKDESLLYYAGLFNSNVRSASGLKQILKSHFSLPVQIKEFVGQWQELIDDVRTRLPIGNGIGQNNQLGKTVMLGKRGWFGQGKINIILGPLSKEQLRKFTPQTPHLKALDELVRLYLGFEHDYSFILRILRKDMPDSVNFANKSSAILGWTSCLSSPSTCTLDPNEIIDISVSAR